MELEAQRSALLVQLEEEAELKCLAEAPLEPPMAHSRIRGQRVTYFIAVFSLVQNK